MKGHTPGPWTLKQYKDSLMVEAGGTVVLRSCGFESTRNAEANALLISAAPDLLAAVRLLIGDLEHREPDGWMSGYVHTKSHDAALAAIAKAEAK